MPAANNYKKKKKSTRTRKKGGRKRTYRKSILGLSFTKKEINYLISFLLGAVVVFSLVYGRRLFVLTSLYSSSFSVNKSELVGIDISYYQGAFQWDDLTVQSVPTHSTSIEGQKVSFIIAKATEGESKVDKRYSINKKNAKKKSMAFGAYHYFKPNSSVKKQAQNFLKNSSLGVGNIIPVLDVEEHGHLSATELQDRVLEWLSIVEKYYGKTPMIYSNLGFYTKYFSGVKFKRYPFWIAAYSRNPKAISNVKIWQCTDMSRVKGIKNKVDLDIFLGNKDEFKKLLL